MSTMEKVIMPEDVIGSLNHAFNEKDINPLILNCEGIQEYCSDVIGDGGVYFGGQAAEKLKIDLNRINYSVFDISIKYIDKILENDRGVWLVKYSLGNNKNTSIGMIYISTSGSTVYRFYMTSSSPHME